MRVVLVLLVLLIVFLLFSIYKKIKLKKEGSKEDKSLNVPQKDLEGNDIISKEEFISRLRYDIVELTKYVDGIIEKDSDDDINYSNLIKAMKMLDNSEIQDKDVQSIVDLRISVENYYNLV